MAKIIESSSEFGRLVKNQRVTDNAGQAQFGRYCAFGVSLGKLFPVDIKTWQVRDGRLYLNLNGDVLKKFNADFRGNVAKADQHWPELLKKHGK